MIIVGSFGCRLYLNMSFSWKFTQFQLERANAVLLWHMKRGNIGFFYSSIRHRRKKKTKKSFCLWVLVSVATNEALGRPSALRLSLCLRREKEGKNCLLSLHLENFVKASSDSVGFHYLYPLGTATVVVRRLELRRAESWNQYSSAFVSW